MINISLGRALQTSWYHLNSPTSRKVSLSKYVPITGIILWHCNGCTRHGLTNQLSHETPRPCSSTALCSVSPTQNSLKKHLQTTLLFNVFQFEILIIIHHKNSFVKVIFLLSCEILCYTNLTSDFRRPLPCRKPYMYKPSLPMIPSW